MYYGATAFFNPKVCPRLASLKNTKVSSWFWRAPVRLPISGVDLLGGVRLMRAALGVRPFAACLCPAWIFQEACA
jgi:hypothetical protein